MCDAYLEHKKEEELIRSKHTREICWTIYKMNADPKTALRTREDFMPLGDKPLRVKKESKAAVNKRIEKAALINAKLNKR